MTKRLFLSIALFLGFLGVKGQVTVCEHVVLNDGTEYFGYIARQLISEGQIIFSAESEICTTSVKGLNVKATNTSFPVKETVPAMQRWIKRSDIGKNGTIIMSDIINEQNPEKTLRGVIVLKQGAMVKYFHCFDSNQNVVIPYSKISSIQKDAYPVNQISGVVENLKSKNGEKFSGQVTEQLLGKSMTVTGSKKKTFPMNDIAAIVREPKHASMSLIQQSPYEETVTLKDQTQYKGVIKEQSYLQNTVTVFTEGGELVKIPSGKIASIDRRPNPKYRVLLMSGLVYGKVIVNNQSVDYDLPMELGKNVMEIQQDAQPVETDGNPLFVEHEQGSGNKEFRLIQLTAKTKKKLFGKNRTVYSFTLEEMNQPIPPTAEYSADGMIHREYKVPAGDYIVYRPADQKGCWVRVK